jgi:hypothetical protein
MEDLILELKGIGENRKLSFIEKFYRSEDGKTIMGEVPFKQFLFIDYRETEAGSNPREY